MMRRTGRAAAAALATPPAQVEKGALAGLLAGFALLSAAILLGGSAASFIDVPSLLIVAGGTSPWSPCASRGPMCRRC